MSDPDRVKQAWRASALDAALPDIATVRGGADKFYRQIRRRNALEYIACGIVIICFSAYAVFLRSPTARLGSAMIVLGTLVIAWQLRRLASAVPPPDSAAKEPILAHQRAQLARQRHALSGVFTWYLLPLIPGLFVMRFSYVLDHGVQGLLHMPRSGWMGLFPMVAIFAAIWLLNQHAARQLQKQIDEIDALTGRNE